MVPRQYLCTVWGITHAKGIPRRQWGQGCNRLGSVSAVQSSGFILQGFFLNMLPYALTPHYHVLKLHDTKTLPCWAAAQPSQYFRHWKKPKKEHKCYDISKLFILRNNIYSGNTKQSFTMFSLVVWIQHTVCMTTWCASLQTSGFPAFQFCLCLLVLKWYEIWCKFIVFCCFYCRWNYLKLLEWIFFFLKKNKQTGSACIRNLNFCCIIFDKGQMWKHSVKLQFHPVGRESILWNRI